MKLEFFTIRTMYPQAAVEELKRFLDAHRVLHIERQFVADGAASYWAVCVTWIGGDTPVAFDAAARRGRVDYREVLGAEEFAVYDRLRTLRTRVAEADGLPPFAVFTYQYLDGMNAFRRAEKRSAFRRMEARPVAPVHLVSVFIDKIFFLDPPELMRMRDAPHSADCAFGLSALRFVSPETLASGKLRRRIPGIFSHCPQAGDGCAPGVGWGELAIPNVTARPSRTIVGVPSLPQATMATWAALTPPSATTTLASGLPERLPPPVGKPSRGTRRARLHGRRANSQGAGAQVGANPKARRPPAFFAYSA